MEWAKKESEKSKETSISRVNAWLHVSLCKDVYTFNVCWLWKECIARLITIIFAKLKIFMFLKDFYWSIVALQCCASFYCTAKWISYQFSSSVVSNSLWPHGLYHARLPCPSPTPRACSNSCLWSQWCHSTISSFVVPFSSCLHSFSTLFQGISSSHEGAKVLELQLQHQSFK